MWFRPRHAMLVVPLLLAACSHSYRDFDGVAGFRVINQDSAQLLASYTADARADARRLEALLTEGCAQQLATRESQVRLDAPVIHEHQGVALVSVPVMAQVAGTQMQYWREFLPETWFYDATPVSISLRTLTAHCQQARAD